MPTTPKPPAKNLPVLTEVVDPDTLPLIAQAYDMTTRTEPGLFATPVIDKEQLVADILRSTLPRLEQQLRASLLALVEEQLALHASRMREGVEAAVQMAVDAAIMDRSS